MEGPELGTNQFDRGGSHPNFISDFLIFRPRLDSQDANEIRRLYIENSLSASQIAAILDCSKTYIISRIRDLGLTGKLSNRADPSNYSLPVAPYGYQIKERKLVISSKEVRIARLIVEMRLRQTKSFSAIKVELERRALKGRSGRDVWHQHSIRRIFSVWKDKI